ncbi:MAG: hypothetical protein AB7G87_01315 [Clostridia bacterium]
MIMKFVKGKAGEGILTGLLWFGVIAVVASGLSVSIWSTITDATTTTNTNLDTSTTGAFDKAKLLTP